MPRMLFENNKEFKKAVAASGGKVVVLVHPVYQRDLKTPKGYSRAFAKLTRSKATVVVLESSHNLNLANHPANTPNSFFVETQLPYPHLTKNWARLNRTFRKAWVKSVLIGGMLALHGGLNRKKAAAIEELDAKLPKPPLRSITAGGVASAYLEISKGRHRRVRLMPELLYPAKPEY